MFSNNVVCVAQVLGPGPKGPGPRPTVGRTGRRTDGRAEIFEKNVKIKKARSEILYKKTCLPAPHHFSKARS